MKFCFIMACITGREHLLNEFVKSAQKSKYKDCDYYLYYQDIQNGKKSGSFDVTFFKNIYISHKRDGVCLPRMYWLHKLDNYDFYVIIDDDMEFLGKEDYETAMEFSQSHEDCGCIDTISHRILKHYNNAVPKKEFRVHNMQYINGGLVLKKEIRDLLVREIALKPYSCDYFHIITYIHGYTNYQYLGSVVLHKAGRKEGFEYVKKNSGEFIPFFENYIDDIYDKNGRLDLPLSVTRLTKEAQRLHEERKK